MGRINRPGQSIFYGSSSFGATFFELDPQIDDCFAVGTWVIDKRFLLFNLGYHDSVFEQHSAKRRIASSPMRELQEPATNPVERLVQATIARGFSIRADYGNENAYKPSIALAEMMLRSSRMPEKYGFPVGGIIYPSFGSNAESDNYGIIGEVANDSLTLVQLDWIAVRSNIEDGFNAEMIDFANSFDKDGNILWKGRPPEWSIPAGGTAIMQAVDGRWTARSIDGTPIEPN